MSAKEIVYDVAARNRLLRGVDTLADAVAVTLGPRGRTVALDEAGRPRSTKDGVTVARSIELADRLENAGAQLVRQVAGQTNDDAGDGTTTAIVLARHMAREGAKAVSMGVNATAVRRGLDAAVEAVVAELRRQPQPVAGARVREVATIAANGDAQVGALLAEAFERIGRDGAVTVEEADGVTTELDVVEGVQLESGYLSPQFVTDGERLVCEVDAPRVLLSAETIASLQPLLPVLEACAKASEPLLIVADGVEGEALTALAVNAQRGGMKLCAVKAPGYGERRRAVLDDLAAVTGAEVIRAETGTSLSRAGADALGRLKRASVFRDRAVLVGEPARGEAIAARCAEIRAEIARTESEGDRDRLQQRLAALAGGVAALKVAGQSEAELRERKDRVDDAVHAVRAALEEGVVAGGGAALLHAARALDGLTAVDDAERLGIAIVREALAEPLRRIAENAGHPPSVVAGKVREQDDPTRGFDARRGEHADMFAAAVVDPVKVVRHALANAASVAGALLTTEAAVADARESDEPAAPDELSA